ncbi:MAG: hypothetical protein GY850_35275 [bacterium]|nr:hypothetical protein [bacterium]
MELRLYPLINFGDEPIIHRVPLRAEQMVMTINESSGSQSASLILRPILLLPLRPSVRPSSSGD